MKKCLRIILILSLLCQLAISYMIRGKTDSIFTYEGSDNGKNKRCVYYLPIRMNFWNFWNFFFQNDPSFTLNKKPYLEYYVKSVDNELEVYKRKHDDKMAESFYRSTFFTDLHIGNNKFSLIELEKSQNDKSVVKSHEQVNESSFSIYQYHVDTRVAILDYSFIEEWIKKGNYISGIASFLKKLKIQKVEIIVISDESFSEYDKIKQDFKDMNLDNIPILLNPGEDNFKEKILEELRRIFLISFIRPFYLRISSDYDELTSLWYYYNIQLISEKEVLIIPKKEIGKEKKPTIKTDFKNVVNDLIKLYPKLHEKKNKLRKHIK